MDLQFFFFFFFFFLLLLLLSLAGGATAAAIRNTISSSCLEKCGDVLIPYPFGIGDGCYLEESFRVTCQEGNRPEVYVASQGEFFGVRNISLSRGKAQMNIWISYACFDSSGNQNLSKDAKFIPIYDLGAAFRLSNVDNKFTAIGCNNIAVMYNSNNKMMGGCFSACSSLADVRDGYCTGQGCCQIANFENNIQVFSFGFGNFDNYSAVYNISPCSSTFYVDQGSFQFRSTDVSTTPYKYKSMPVVVDWAIRSGNKTCQQAQADNSSSSYACRSNNSECLDSINGPGYICNCSIGFQGNPYLSDGCQDIDECILQPDICHGGICTNNIGSYECVCQSGYHGDAKNGTCTSDPGDGNMKILKILLGTLFGILFLVILAIWIYLGFQKRKLIKMKHEFFQKNGGFLLQEEIKSHHGAGFKIFTKEELEKATNNFDESNILGRGGHGIVYKGTLNDKRVAAIKKSKLMDKDQTAEFAREMAILCQINHRNIVKILGCCLEVEFPMIVYEFISRGTLSQYIHNRNYQRLASLDTRLRIAEESAIALAYLHSYALPPIVHSDVKPANILLDDTYTAKISDFGASKLAPTDENVIATVVQGTCGYLDPEYLETYKLTTKSDVYSFGVVLLEILTGRKVLYFQGSEEEASLTSNFKSAMKENRLQDIFDIQIINEGTEELVGELATLIMQCLSLTGEERPTMSDIVDDLRRFRKYKQDSWREPSNSEELQRLIVEIDHDATTDGLDTRDSSTLLAAGTSSVELTMGGVWSKDSRRRA